MKIKLTLISFLLLLFASATLANDLREVTATGGNSSESPSYRLSSTVGQAVTGLVAAGERVASQGFWGGMGKPFFFVCGDLDGDSLVNITDVVFIIDRIFLGGPPPSDEKVGDVNCDDRLDISDAVYLIQYIFNGGPIACANCPVG
jgi:hypothetical protein